MKKSSKRKVNLNARESKSRRRNGQDYQYMDTMPGAASAGHGKFNSSMLPEEC